jgi:uncharacterized glyoxalase superfamily protein PhnB
MIRNRSMPPGRIIPELAYPDVRDAATWLCFAFGFRERLVIGSHRVQLTFGGASIIVIEGPDTAFSDQSSGEDRAPTHAVMMSVDDVDAVFERAVQNGAVVVRPLADHPYGERQCTVRDPGGHVWTLSQSIADVDPADWGGVVGEAGLG